METHRNLILLAAAVLTPLVTACNSSTAPEQQEEQQEMGAVTAVVHDSLEVLPAGRSTVVPPDSTLYTGDMDGNIQVAIYSATDGWVSLGESQTVSFAIFCYEASTAYAAVSVPADTYSKVRLTLQGFGASVDAGAVVQTVEYADAFTVDMTSAGDVVIEKDVTPFMVSATESAVIEFDLNSEVWMDGTVVADGTVAASEIAAATVVYIE